MATSNGNGNGRTVRGPEFLVKFVKTYTKAANVQDVAKALDISPAMVSTYASKLRKGNPEMGFAPIPLKKFPRQGRGGITKEQWAEIAKAAQAAK